VVQCSVAVRRPLGTLLFLRACFLRTTGIDDGIKSLMSGNLHSTMPQLRGTAVAASTAAVSRATTWRFSTLTAAGMSRR
jgi:hypothetical protein